MFSQGQKVWYRSPKNGLREARVAQVTRKDVVLEVDGYDVPVKVAVKYLPGPLTER